MDHQHWKNRGVFILAAVGSAVGLGNVWRFPYIAYSNGGGAFLIPYFVALFIAGVPLLILEFSLGRMVQKGAPQAMEYIKKEFKWLGWFAILIGSTIVVYYAVIMSWCFGYLIYSFTLKWGANPETFFYGKYLGLLPFEKAGHFGGVQIPILIGLAVTWIWIFLSIFKGVDSVGKVVLVTVPLPVLILVILIIRGVTLPGALDGLNYFLSPNFKALLNPDVWIAAFSQVFFSMSIGFGIMIAYASYLPDGSDINNNALLAGLLDALIAFMGGLAVFSVLGYLAYTKGVAVPDVVTSGPGLAFVTYPTILSLLPFWVQFFSVLFFIMLLTLGIDSAFSLVEAFVAGVEDYIKIKRETFIAIVCFIAFILGIPFATKGGLYYLDVIDHYLTSFGLIFVGLLESILVGWVLGSNKVREFANLTSDFKIGKWWDISIKFIIPLILGAMLIINFINSIGKLYGGYPLWLNIIAGPVWIAILLVISFYLSYRLRKGV